MALTDLWCRHGI